MHRGVGVGEGEEGGGDEVRGVVDEVFCCEGVVLDYICIRCAIEMGSELCKM